MRKKFLLKTIVLFVTITLFFSINDLIDNSESKNKTSDFDQDNFKIPMYIDSSSGLPTEGQWPYTTRVGDINEDGYLDIIRLRGHDDFEPEDQGFQIWLGDGNGGWTKTYISNGNFGYGGTGIGDFNNDGHLDAAYGVHHNRNHPLMGAWAGDGGTSFTECSDGLATDGETWGMGSNDFGDFNNDGYMDLGYGSFGGGNGPRVYENINGGSSWVSKSNGLPHHEQNPNTGNWVYWEDMNRDGYLDLVIGTQNTSPDLEEHVIWKGDGKGNWAPGDKGLNYKLIWWSAGLDVGDINNDGWEDIAFTKKVEVDDQSWNIPVVFIFDGTKWHNASEGLPSPDNYPPTSFGPLALGDLNNDGYLDLVALESTGDVQAKTNVHAWLGDGTGKWGEIDEIATNIPGGPESVTLADIDHNNYLDIIISSDNDDYEPGGLRVFKERTAKNLGIKIRKPSGGEVFTVGAVRKIIWTSGVPSGRTSTVKLEYSTLGPDGPWRLIDSGLLDSNYYQWTIPNTPTGNGYLRATVKIGGQSVSTTTSIPFIIGRPGNYPPQADFTYTINDRTIFLNASKSWDADGDIVSYEWDLGDDVNSNGEIVNHTYEDYGIYTVSLTVTDDDGHQSTNKKKVEINDGEPPVIKNLRVNPPVQSYRRYVNVSAEVTDNVKVNNVKVFLHEPDDKTTEIDITGNVTGDIYYFNRTYWKTGTYYCYMKAEDTSGNSFTSEEVSFEIGENLSVSANGPYTARVDENIQFKGTVHGGTPPYTYTWDFGDGTTSDEQNPTHAYSNIGEYEITFRVRDAGNLTATDNTTINILENTPPNVKTLKPQRALYIKDHKTLPFLAPLIIGDITIEATAEDSSGIGNVVIAIDGKEILNLSILSVNNTIITTTNFSVKWTEKSFGMHTIQTIAVDTPGNRAYDETVIWKFF